METEYEGEERGKKERLKKRSGGAAQVLWCCRAPADWRRIWGLKGLRWHHCYRTAEETDVAMIYICCLPVTAHTL